MESDNLKYNRMNTTRIINTILSILLTGMMGTSCSDDSVGPSMIEAAFSFTVNNPLKVSFTNESAKATRYGWNFGDGTSSSEENPMHEYLAGGTYKVTLIAKSSTGSKIIIHDVTVEGVPEVNLLQGSDMSNAADWNLYSAGATLTTAEFADGKLKFSNGAGPAQTNILLWQAVEVEADVEYRFSADVKGSGATNSWAELLFGTVQPANGSDYSNGLYTGINTWDGCGTSAFEGNFATISCKAPSNGKGGVVSFANSGTIYVVLKVGSWDGSWGASGITFDNIKLVKL
jgi:PKD repeat protein